MPLRLLLFGCNLKGEFWGHKFCGLCSVRALGFVPIESPPTTSQYLSIQSFVLSTTVWSNSNVKLRPAYGPPFGVENVTNRNVASTFLFDLSQCRPILHRLATIHNPTGSEKGPWIAIHAHDSTNQDVYTRGLLGRLPMITTSNSYVPVVEESHRSTVVRGNRKSRPLHEASLLLNVFSKAEGY